MSEVITCPTCKRDWPRHGMCCTCQLCGKHYDDCRCLADDLNDALEKMMRERDRLREALRKIAEMLWPEMESACLSHGLAGTAHQIDKIRYVVRGALGER